MQAGRLQHALTLPISQQFDNRTMKRPYRNAKYLGSAHTLKQLPADEGREVAIAGRSNSGKSSSVNRITDQKSLARTSKTPGRTQQIVSFGLTDDLRLADLPGYGYAKVPLSLKAHWQQTLDAYFRQRQSLQGLILVVDIRRPLKEFDLTLLEWSHRVGLASHLLMNKADKLKRGAVMSALRDTELLLKQAALATTLQVFSAKAGTGLEEVYQVLDRWLEITLSPKPS